MLTKSGFCVMKGILGILTHGVYRTTAIKKTILAQVMQGDTMKACLQDKGVGYIYAVCGDMDGNKYKIQCIKEADYVMNLFSTNGSLSKRCRETSRTYKNRGEMVTKFFYPEPMDIHFLYRHKIDDHNHCKHQPIGMENVWGKCLGRIGYSHSYFLSPISTPTSSTTTLRSSLRGQF